MDDEIAELTKQEGWHAEGRAARVHYEGAERQFAIEYYARTEHVLYWRVPEDGTTAAPVARANVPTPLRKRVRRDLEEAGVDPELDRTEI